MMIATWNVNSLRVRLSQLLDWLDTHRPEVVLLQETKVTNELFPLDELAERGYHVAMHGQKSYNGVAILSRLPLREVVVGFGGEDLAGQARVIAATLGKGAAVRRVVSVYCVNGEALGSEKFALKEQFYARLTAYVQALAAQGVPLVVGGDFNIAADARDVDDVAKRAQDVLFTPQERGWLAEFGAQTGLVDALRVVNQDGGIFSWWDYRAGAVQAGRGLRIDYLWVSPSLKVDAVVHHKDLRLLVQPSDHIPVSAILVTR